MYPFEYCRPSSIEEATALMHADARFLAGGQTLLQTMKLRLAAVERLVDLGGIDSLRTITRDGDELVIGAMATHASVGRSEQVRSSVPVLASVAGGIGDRMVRHRGTIGGSIANADPAACYPCALLGLGATIVTNRRTIAAESFFTGLFETALGPAELVTAVRFPPVRQAAYIKLKQPASRFALVGVLVARNRDGVRVAVTGAAEKAFRSTELESALSSRFEPEAAEHCPIDESMIRGDLHGSSRYRAQLIRVAAGRAVAVVRSLGH